MCVFLKIFFQALGHTFVHLKNMLTAHQPVISELWNKEKEPFHTGTFVVTPISISSFIMKKPDEL